jgi:hypothetical protein
VPAIYALQFAYRILLALAGSQDAHGRWAAIAAPINASGFAWAAIASGIIVERLGIQALAIATLTGMSLCTLLLMLTRKPALVAQASAMRKR